MNEPNRKKTRRSEQQWRTIIAEQAQSGESIQRFCQRRGIALSTFGQWKSRLSGKVSSVTKDSDFLELSASTDRLEPHWNVELTLGEGFVLRVVRR